EYGFTHPRLFAKGAGPSGAVYAVTASTRGDSGVLLVTLDPASAGSRPIVAERAATPADLGIRSVEMRTFLGTRNLLDVTVLHQPFMLETGRTFTTHHVIRQQAETLIGVCDLEGGSSSAYSKGIGSNVATRDVVIARLPGSGVSFSVRITAKTVDRQDGNSRARVDSTTRVRWYEIPAVGICRELPAPRP
ncbi:MAG: hypothetical protein ACREK8_04630, partial [Gemmatimonadales bacterium]